jgi:hypothetical protein
MKVKSQNKASKYNFIFWILKRPVGLLISNFQTLQLEALDISFMDVRILESPIS